MRKAWLMLGALVAAAGPEPALRQVDATGVLGRTVLDAGGHDVGRIVDVVVEPSGQPDAVVIDTGGFLGVGARRVAVDWAAVHVPTRAAADTPVTIDLTDEQVRSAPAYNDRTKPATVVGSPGASPAPGRPAEGGSADDGKAAVP